MIQKAIIAYRAAQFFGLPTRICIKAFFINLIKIKR